MIEMPSRVENEVFTLKQLEDKLKPLGYDIGGNWDYDHAYFDYKIDDDGSYHFLRIPLQAVNGEIGQKGVTVRLGRPFLLSHKYTSGLDDQVMSYNAFFNQFSEPEDKDAEVPPRIVETGQHLMMELEATLLD